MQMNTQTLLVIFIVLILSSCKPKLTEGIHTVIEQVTTSDTSSNILSISNIHQEEDIKTFVDFHNNGRIKEIELFKYDPKLNFKDSFELSDILP